MKVRIVGEGELNRVVKGYLTPHKTYMCHKHPVLNNLSIIEDDDGDEITINVKNPKDCGHLGDAFGDLRWEVVDEN